MSVFDRLREAVTGGPRYTPNVSPYASTREQQKNDKVRAREARRAAERRRGHRESVARKGDAAGIPFDSGRNKRGRR